MCLHLFQFTYIIHIKSSEYNGICLDSETHIVIQPGWFIGVLRHMRRYFSHICDGTDVQAD